MEARAEGDGNAAEVATKEIRFPADGGMLIHFLVVDPDASFRDVRSEDFEQALPANGILEIPANKRLIIRMVSDDAPLDLSWLRDIKPDVVYALAIAMSDIPPRQTRHLAELKSLRALSLGPLSRVTDEALVPVGRLTELESLSLPETEVTDDGIAALRRLHELRELNLYGTKVSDPGLQHFSGMRKLRVLNLGRTHLLGPGLQQLVGLGELEDLSLNGTQIDDRDLAHVARLAGLKRLDLSQTPVSDEGLQHLQRLKNLEQLDLSHTQVRGEGLMQLVELPRLKEVRLFGTPVSEAALRKFASSAPKVRVARE